MYLSKKSLAGEYDISLSTIEKQFRFIRKYIGTRYPEDSFCKTGKILRVRDDVFKDAMLFRNQIRDGTAPEFVSGEVHIWGG